MQAQRAKSQQAQSQQAQSPGGLGLPELALAVQAPPGSLHQARELGLLPPADFGAGRWSAEAARQLAESWPQISAALTDAEELGAVKCADLLSRITGLAITRAHIEGLAACGMLASGRSYRRRPLYRTADVRALAQDPVSRAHLTEIAPVLAD